MFENSEWLLLPDVKIQTVIEQFLHTTKNPVDTYPEDIFRYSQIMSNEEISSRLAFTVFDIYKAVGFNGVKELIFENKQYNDINAFGQDLAIAAGSYTDPISTERYDNNVYIVYKEKVNRAVTPISTYSNGLYCIMKGKHNMMKPRSGVNPNMGAFFPNFSSMYGGNLGRFLMKKFWGFETANMTDDMIWYTRNLRTLYNQLELNTWCYKNNGIQYNAVSDSMEANHSSLRVVGEPKILGSKSYSTDLELIEYTWRDSGYSYFYTNDFMVLIYPCKADNQEKYGFLIKPLGVDQVTVVAENASNELTSDDVMLELKFGKTKHKIYKKVTDAVSTGYYKRIKLFSLIRPYFMKNIHGNTLTDIKIFTVNKRTKTRSNISNASAKLHIGGVNMAASFVSKRH